MLDALTLWLDDVARDGPENMAVDEWLLATATAPVLRVYRWRPEWGSFGYFVRDADAAASLPGLHRVRRWTGGGIVDHRRDWTYTVVAPGRGGLAGAKGGESYRVIHEALVAALGESGVEARLESATAPARGGECFVRAVEHDLVGADGRKLAGAGQRRAKTGLLHQGSVALEGSAGLAREMAARLAKRPREVVVAPPAEEIEARAGRYREAAWAARR